MFPSQSWQWGLLWGGIDLTGVISLEKTAVSPSIYQMPVPPQLVVGLLCPPSPSTPGLYLAVACMGLVHAVTVGISHSASALLNLKLYVVISVDTLPLVLTISLSPLLWRAPLCFGGRSIICIYHLGTSTTQSLIICKLTSWGSLC